MMRKREMMKATSDNDL